MTMHMLHSDAPNCYRAAVNELGSDIVFELVRWCLNVDEAVEAIDSVAHSAEWREARDSWIEE